MRYNEHHKGYKCMDRFGKTYISRYVRFNESYFPYKHWEQLSHSTSLPLSQFDSHFTYASPPLLDAHHVPHYKPLSTSFTATTNACLNNTGVVQAHDSDPTSVPHVAKQSFGESLGQSSPIAIDIMLPTVATSPNVSGDGAAHHTSPQSTPTIVPSSSHHGPHYKFWYCIAVKCHHSISSKFSSNAYKI